MPQVWLSIGSNVEREHHVRTAVNELRERFADVVISPVYESEAVGFKGEPFYNLVVGISTEEDVTVLARFFRDMEMAHGRRRGSEKFAPRTLDVDILTYGDETIQSESLSLPRDEITRYAFVLRPLADVAGDELHPVSGVCYRDLWLDFDASGQALHQVDFDFNLA